MDESEIAKLLRHLPCFLGVYARDELPKSITEWPAALVVNTDPRSKPGRHWVAFFLRDRHTIEYFDPYGIRPLYSEFKTFIKRNSNQWFYNEIQFQPTVPLSVACGLYCILFIRIRCNGISFNEFIRLFAKNIKFNDVLLEIYLKYIK